MSKDNQALNWSLDATNVFYDHCRVGLQGLGLDFFHFVRVDVKGRRTMLATHTDWLQLCYDEHLLETPLALMIHEHLSSGAYPWHEFEQADPWLRRGREQLGFRTGISIVIRQPNVAYHYHFGSATHDSYDYSQGLQAIYRFIPSFHDKAESLLREAYRHAWTIELAPSSASPIPAVKAKSLEDLPEEIHYQRWVLPWQESALQFSSREMECLACLMEGLTAKQIGRRLGISHRTVQTHWERIRMKVGTRSCHDLVVAMRGSGLAHLIAQSLQQA